MPSRSRSPESASVTSRSDETKARNPRPFDGGDPSQLRTFLLQTNLAIDARPSEFSNEKSKILYAISYLEGAALEWAYPLYRMADQPDYMTDFTLFTKQLERAFGDDELIVAEKLRQLKQTSSVAKYSMEFRRLSSRVDWGSTSLYSQFYSGLKNTVKLEIAKGKRPGELEELIAAAIAIDHFQREALAQLSPAPRPLDQPRRDYRRDAPSAASSGRRLTEQQREHRLRNNLCLYCGGEGHIIRNCPQRQPRPAHASVAALVETEPPGNEPTQPM
jgi:hypothetical protein